METYEQLEQLTTDQLIERYNNKSKNTFVGTQFYLD